LHSNRHLDSATASVSGDLRDTLLSGGINTWSVAWHMGRVGFDDAGAQRADAASADTQGRFSLWNASVGRLQSVGATDALCLALSVQWSNANLDPAQKMAVGGAYTVRDRDMGVLSDDIGILATIEWRHDLGVLWDGTLQAVGFADSQHVTINHTVWASGPDSATLKRCGCRPHLDLVGSVERQSQRRDASGIDARVDRLNRLGPYMARTQQGLLEEVSHRSQSITLSSFEVDFQNCAFNGSLLHRRTRVSAAALNGLSGRIVATGRPKESRPN
jgi:Haemolysin secretion/activation protein ShlB/FhaC/HecB